MLAKIEIEIEEETKTMLDLALLLSKTTMQEAFQEFANYYVKKILSDKISKQKNQTQDDYEEEPISGSAQMIMYDNSKSIRDEDKVFRRLPLWARRNTSYIHQIIRAYFLTEQNGVANLSDMYDEFLNIFPDVTRTAFQNNIIALTSDCGNASGHLFNLSNENVTVYEPALKHLNKYKNYFTRGV